LEGIIPALETAHALALLHKIAPTIADNAIVLLCMSGRGDKDVFSLMKHINL
jgi:tryptophan synthase beta chain